jgi:hypothetical protein
VSRFLVDKNGDVTPAFDEQLTEKFGYPMPDFDLPSYAVRNLGAIDIDLEDTRTIVRFRWLTVTREAIEACARLLLDLSASNISIHCEAAEWTEQQFATAEDAVAWLGDSQHTTLEANQRRATPHFVIQPQNLKALASRPLNRLEEPEDHFSLFFKKWRISQGQFSTDVTESFVRFGDIDRAVIASERTDGRICFEHIGARITVYNRADDAWTFRLSGRPIGDQFDHEYGRQVESVFRRALDMQEPQYDHVDAVIQDGRGPVRFRYNRLLLPWQHGSSSRILTSLSFKTAPDSPVYAEA